MIKKFSILFFWLRNQYYIHLIYSIFFFLKKNLNYNLNYKEKFSYKTANKICEKKKISKRKFYNYIINNNKFKKNIKKFKLKVPRQQINSKMGGGSDINLIYNLVIFFRPKKIIEFGVASGWSTLSILSGCNDNKYGKLTSIDMPYCFKGSKLLIGNLVNKRLKKNWKLIISPQINILKKLKKNFYNFCHYDSDKTYQGRMYAYEKIWISLKKNGILISDDISDNMAFFDFCKKYKSEPFIIKFKNKFLGILIK